MMPLSPSAPRHSSTSLRWVCCCWRWPGVLVRRLDTAIGCWPCRGCCSVWRRAPRRWPRCTWRAWAAFAVALAVKAVAVPVAAAHPAGPCQPGGTRSSPSCRSRWRFRSPSGSRSLAYAVANPFTANLHADAFDAPNAVPAALGAAAARLFHDGHPQEGADPGHRTGHDGERHLSGGHRGDARAADWRSSSASRSTC